MNAIKTVAEGGSIVKPAVTQRLLKGLENLHNEFSSLDRPDPLTERELEVLRLLRSDLSLRDVAGRLYISHNTIKGYTKSIYRKLGVSSRESAIEAGRELGLI